ncbi:hypothetical protein CKK34_3906 [Yarrowia sp. E02]|nr:hypothetical protein CKK34_3906 [Yarrowia sp. E02]
MLDCQGFDDNKVEDSTAGSSMPQDGQADGLTTKIHAQHQARAHVADRLAGRLSAPTDLIRQQYLAEEARETEKQGNGYRKSSDATFLGGAWTELLPSVGQCPAHCL